MKIGQPSDKPVPVNTTTQAVPPKGGQGASATAPATETKKSQSAGVAVTVSNLARALETENRSAAADVDAEKVQSVRSAIEQGTYVVNPEAIADKLLANAQEMLNRTHS